MRFYDREQEIAFLRKERVAAETVARFTVVTGRRRIGKTTLITTAYEDSPFVYFFVARKAEADLCEVYLEEKSRIGLYHALQQQRNKERRERPSISSVFKKKEDVPIDTSSSGYILIIS